MTYDAAVQREIEELFAWLSASPPPPTPTLVGDKSTESKT